VVRRQGDTSLDETSACADSDHQKAQIKNGEPAIFEYYYDQLESDVNRKGGRLDQIKMPVYICEDDNRPMYPELGTTGTYTMPMGWVMEGEGKLMTDAGRCKQLVILTADLNKIPKKALKREEGEDHQWYYKIWFQIEMTCHLANITFDLVHEWEKEDGNVERVEYGSVKADYK
jgi:hypothetical protein